MKGPKISLKLSCHDCEYLEFGMTQLDAVWFCNKLSIDLDIDHACGCGPIPDSNCPYLKDNVKDFHLKAITPENKGVTILKTINGGRNG